MKTINYICSLGSQCSTASWIKQKNMKKCSYPFDWIYSNPKMIIDCINDDFVKFLDRSLHIPTTYKKKQKIIEYKNISGHKIYKRKNSKGIFNHHYILEDKQYEYFVRCVNRFRELTKINDNKLFIISFMNEKQDITKNLQKQLNDLYTTLQKITNNFDLLVVWHTCGTELKSNVIEDKELNNLKYINITTINRNNGRKIKDKKENKFYNRCIFELYNFQIIDNIK